MENSVPTSIVSVHKVTEFKSNLTLKPNSNKLPLSWTTEQALGSTEQCRVNLGKHCTGHLHTIENI